MEQKIITPKAGIKDENGAIKERVCFPMKWVSAVEEGEFWKRLGECDQEADKKEELRFEVMVEALASWTVEMPFIRVVKKGIDGKEENIDTPLTGDSPSDAVREYFKTRTIEQDRTVNGLISAYNNRIAPDIVF